MSIQDESFPHVALLDEQDLSANFSRNFVFPNDMRAKRERTQPPAMSTNSSDSDQNISSETSTNGGRPLSELSAKTSGSDPLGLMESDAKPLHSSKAASYMDIHSEYTKRRYKHVESKVGQYIASIKADDQRRRSQVRFQRHRSMPDTLTGVSFGAGAQTNPLTANGTAELTGAFKKNYATNSDTEADSSGNTNTSVNTMGTASTSASAASHVYSGVADFNEKSPFEQLIHEKERIQSYSDYLQTRLDEKNGETTRLKRNVDFLRIELSNCMDQLKKQQCLLTNTTSGSSNSLDTLSSSLGRHSLQSLVYCQAKSTKSTQTDLLTPPPPQLPPPLLRARDYYITPDTPDTNNNTFGDSDNKAVVPCATSSINCLPVGNRKSVVTIQPLSLNFSSNAEDATISSSENNHNNAQLLQNSSDNSASSNVLPAPPRVVSSHSRVGCHSSSNSAIDIEAIELDAIGPKRRNSFRRVLQSSARVRPQLKGYESEEVVYYDQAPSRLYKLANAAASDCSSGQDENYNVRNKRLAGKTKAHTSRCRWLRLLGPCVRCKEFNPNQSESNNGSQRPLL